MRFDWRGEMRLGLKGSEEAVALVAGETDVDPAVQLEEGLLESQELQGIYAQAYQSRIVRYEWCDQTCTRVCKFVVPVLTLAGVLVERKVRLFSTGPPERVILVAVVYGVIMLALFGFFYSLGMWARYQRQILESQDS